jgi:hypothetical protein
MALCSNSKSTDQRLESMRWYFGKRECRNFTLVETDADQGEYFELKSYSTSYEVESYVVFLDDGVATAPALSAGQTLISVSVADGDSANIKCLAIETAIQASSGLFRTEVSGDSIEIQNAIVGEVESEDVSGIVNIVKAVGAVGFGGYIGQTGESELTTTIEVVQLLDDAQGTVIQDEIITGYGAEITIPLREMTTDRWQDLIGSVSGNNVTLNSKEITGWGTEKLYQSMFLYSGRLIGHPVRLPATNVSEDIVMLNTAPKLNSINFSGASIQEAEFLFTAYKDASAPSTINLVARGDHTEF